MIDIKFVIKGLEDAKDVIRKSENTGSKKVRLIDACCNAITLLKEQPEIVRCKDCKYYDCFNGCVSWHDVNSNNDNWYCADGERKK